jgi:hypothetical protein
MMPWEIPQGVLRAIAFTFAGALATAMIVGAVRAVRESWIDFGDRSTSSVIIAAVGGAFAGALAVAGVIAAIALLWAALWLAYAAAFL